MSKLWRGILRIGINKWDFRCSAYSFTGMLSACANPILYGLLNENFKSEFKLIFKTFFHKWENARDDMIMDHLVQGSSGSWSHSCVRNFFFKLDKQMPFKARLSVVMLKNSWGVDNLYGLGQRSSLLFTDVTRQPNSTAQPNQIQKSILAAAQAKLRLSLRLDCQKFMVRLDGLLSAY